jgi:hypothetical protein
MAESTVNSVRMTDGRIVDFVGKRKMLKDSFADEATGKISVRFDFVNGETRTFVLNPALIAKFAAHGAEQKYGDETAGLNDVEDAILAIDELDARLQKGEWKIARESSGVAGTSVLVRALVEYLGKPVDEVKAKLSALSQAEKMALRTNAKIKPIIDRIEADKAAKAAKVDTEGLLANMQ